ncbi:Crp/Fnr family transcriptional regulator [uncultured Lactobacillus sp.]|uniref:Crp/Fnr family transcriptional regulator n=1 Tax=uncultured Lactobacillus sp. TaxID=153152 RepID=UPI00280399B2|nr:Crp/Fnr family transcriptional regulator [uncultured Lactobacillus sp.]
MKKHSAIGCISRAGLFSQLPHSMLEKIALISTHQEYFPKGSFIRQPGDGKDGMMFVDDGSAKIYNLNRDGKETVLGVLNKGDYDGQQNLFQQDSHENFIQALQDTYICSINRTDFQKLLKNTPDLTINLLNNFGEKLVAIEANSVRRNSMNAKDRLMDYLIEQSQKIGAAKFTLPLKKKDLASYLGTSPETLSRQLKLLEKEGKLKVNRREITIIEN